jgi:hypothetical protein
VKWKNDNKNSSKMKHITQNTKELQGAIFQILKRWDKVDRGWWRGYGQLDEELQEDYGLKVIYLDLYKDALRSLKAEGKVITMPIFDMDWKLNGSGWFFNYFELKNDLKC